MMDTIGFLGCGNMGGAIARAVCKAVDPKKVFLANRTAAKAQALAKELGCKTATNAEVAGDCDLIFLAVKPQMMEALLQPLKFTFDERPSRFVLCSMAARNADRPVARQAGQPQQMRTGAYTTPQQRPQTNNGVSPVQVRPATPVPQTQDMQNRPQVGYRTPIQPLTKPQETPSTAAPKSTTTMENPYARPVAKSAEEAPRHRRRTDQYRQDDDSANPNG